MIDVVATGKNIDRLRKYRGLSVDFVASKVGVSRQAVYKWIEGKSIPTIDSLIILARLFHVRVEDILIVRR